jgi:hypothetical protein
MRTSAQAVSCTQENLVHLCVRRSHTRLAAYSVYTYKESKQSNNSHCLACVCARNCTLRQIMQQYIHWVRGSGSPSSRRKDQLQLEGSEQARDPKHKLLKMSFRMKLRCSCSYLVTKVLSYNLVSNILKICVVVKLFFFSGMKIIWKCLERER